MPTLQDYANSWSDEQVDKDIRNIEEERKNESPFFNLKDGEERAVRVLPSLTLGTPFVRFGKHWYDDPVTKKPIRFACPENTHVAGFSSYKCPACAQASNKYNSFNKADQEEAKNMRSKWKALCNILVRPTDAEIEEALEQGLEPPVGKVKLWEFSSWSGKKNGKNMHERILALRTNARIGGALHDPTENGFDILVSREGEKFNTKYHIHALRGERRPLHPDNDQAIKIIEEDAHDILYWVTPPTAEQLQQVLQGERYRPSTPGLGSATGAPMITATAGDLVSSDEGYGRGGDTGAGF